MSDEPRREGIDEDDLSDEALDGGMEVAFGAAKPASGEGILDTIERVTGTASRILLPDAPDEEPDLVKVSPKGDADAVGDDSRYQIVGEIARGGVGVVFKGRDKDLGRDVALKVLRHDLAKVPQVVQRFIEEAQVEGQLQHPGIIPVYGLGIQPDGRPFFAMKLVKGDTLAARFRERPGPDADRRRYLAVFEQVCQTVAYAHARRVIHRDLKPSNILLGAFGQVQVVDWGFAKVLSRGGLADERPAAPEKPEVSIIETIRSGVGSSVSVVGSVMGTPAYMPPEQARGEVEKVDERADVFSLGAILTEMLTGKALYEGEQREMLLQAAEARLDPALARLDACGADEDLVALARRCLAPAREVRPRHAGELAEAIGAYLAGLERRARDAELAAAAAHARAEEERRTRRVSVALAAVVLLSVVFGSGGWLVVSQRRAARIDRVAARVGQEMNVASEKLGAKAWDEATAAAERAIGLAETGEADAATVAEARELLDRVRAARAEDETRVAREDRDRQLLRKLSDVRGMRGEGFEAEDVDQKFAARFAEAGLDPAKAEDWEERLRAFSRPGELVAALDDWAMVRREAGGDAGALTDLSRRLDPDDFRNRVRTLRADLSADDLRALERSEDVEALPVRSLLLLADALGRAGDSAEAVALCRLAQRKDPFDFDASFSLAFWLVRLSPPRKEEAVPYFSKALSQRPESVAVRYHLGAALDPAKEPDWQLSIWREACDRDRDYGPLVQSLGVAVNRKGMMLTQAGRLEAGAACFEEADELLPDNSAILGNLGTVHMRRGDVRGGIPFFRRAADLAPESSLAQMNLGQALLNWGDYPAAEARLREALALASGNQQARWGLAQVLAKQGHVPEAIREYRTLLEGTWVDRREYAVLLRIRGDFAGSIQELRRTLDTYRLDYACHVELIRALRAAGDAAGVEQAEAEMVETFRQAVEQGLNNRSWHSQLGWALGRRHSREEAVAIFEGLGEEHTDEQRAYFHLALGFSLWDQQMDEAGHRESVLAALRLLPDYSGTQQEYARALFRAAGRQATDEAIAAARRALELNGENWLCLDLLHGFLKSRGEYAEAAEAARRRLAALEKQTSQSVLVRESVLVTERCAEWKDRARELASGGVDDLDRVGRLALVELLTQQGQHPRAVEIAESVLDRFPPDLGVPYLDRFRRADDLEAAARAAALAAEEAGPADPEAAAGFRRRTRTWLLEAVGLYRELLSTPGQSLESSVLRATIHMLSDSRLAGIRDPDRIAELPEEERAALADLWRQARELWEAAK